MKDKTVAALLAIFLGWAGIHKFYLGETLAGILYLTFFWTCIPGLISFFECIGLLVMSDQDFNAKYNPGLTGRSTPVSLAYSNESSKDKASTLRELKNLYEAGIITAEEFEEKRRKILDSM